MFGRPGAVTPLTGAIRPIASLSSPTSGPMRSIGANRVLSNGAQGGSAKPLVTYSALPARSRDVAKKRARFLLDIPPPWFDQRGNGSLSRAARTTLSAWRRGRFLRADLPVVVRGL